MCNQYEKDNQNTDQDYEFDHGGEHGSGIAGGRATSGQMAYMTQSGLADSRRRSRKVGGGVGGPDCQFPETHISFPTFSLRVPKVLFERR